MKIPLFLLVLLLCRNRPAAGDQIQYKHVQKDGTVTLKCGELTEGLVTWSRDRNGRREDIVRIENGLITRLNDPSKRYTNNGLSLIISHISLYNAGLYYCNSTAVACLTVTSGPNVTDKCVQTHLETGRLNKTDKCEKPETRKRWTALIITGSVLLALALVFWKWISQKKDDDELADHIYSTVDFVTFDKAQTGRAQKPKEKESVYDLATHPGPAPTGLQNEPLYSLVQKPAARQQNTDPVEEGLYSLAQRPHLTSEEAQTSVTAHYWRA
ncbi:uncharacterized protein [Salminus brasiliensis]|uniref:uncharacterized protein isoform X2 n=1 Tax=Salminus brasiliensis TaxID=930266 RepID=UPI003B838451